MSSSNDTASVSSTNYDPSYDHLTSPVTVLPLVLVLIVVVVVIIAGLVIYRRKKQLKLLKQLKLTEKRIKVVTEYLENVSEDPDDSATTNTSGSSKDESPRTSQSAATEAAGSARGTGSDQVNPVTVTAEIHPPNSPKDIVKPCTGSSSTSLQVQGNLVPVAPVPFAPSTHHQPVTFSSANVFTGPKPIYISSSELSLTDLKADEHELQTSLEVQCSTPTVAGRRQRAKLRRFVRPNPAMIGRNKTFTIHKPPSISLEEYCRVIKKEFAVTKHLPILAPQDYGGGPCQTRTMQHYHLDMCSSEISPFEVTSTSIRNNYGTSADEADEVQSQSDSVLPDGNCSVYQTAIELQIPDDDDDGNGDDDGAGSGVGSEVWV